MVTETEKNNIVIINGPTRGLGLALVNEILKLEKYHVVCLVRDLASISGLSKFEKKVQIIECDYGNTKSVNNIDCFFEETLKSKWDNVYFINNLSVVTPIGKIGLLSNDDIQNSITINLLSNIMVINSFLKYTRSSGSVNILNISSGISQKPVAGLGLYGLAKSFTDYISEVIFKENDNIRVASFYPGGMKTDMQGALQKGLMEAEALNEFDYSGIFNQELVETKKIAKIISINFLQGNKGWDKLISKIYDYNGE